ncbi:MAG: cation transporter, partial [Lachnospiraceae bacterium]|nr:cation transporter [Lachnospiraceae bacterium]
LICILILKVAFDIAKDAVNKMLDTSCDDAMEQNIRTFTQAQPGVVRIDLLRTRQFSNKVYVDLEIAVKHDMSLLEAHNIAESVHDALEKEFPNIKHVMIHVNPDITG